MLEHLNDGNIGDRLLLEVDQAVSLESSAQTMHSWWAPRVPIGFRGVVAHNKDRCQCNASGGARPNRPGIV